MTLVAFLTALILFLLILMCVFLICLVLIQRGKGGGLAGAFGGGAGGSSAFGTKAGDVFTRVTMITAGIWIAMNMVLVILSNQRTSAWGVTPEPGSINKSAFSTPADKVAPSDANALPAPKQTDLGTASPFDALSPPNVNAPAPSPLGTGQPTEGRSELPESPFEAAPASAPPSPLPVGATPSGGSGNPKP